MQKKPRLKLGFMSGQEIADWLNIKYQTYAHKREDKLDILKDYCEFEEARGGIEITEIFISEYAGPLNTKDVKLAVEYVTEQQKIQNRVYPLLTGTMMAQDFVNRKEPVYMNLKPKSAAAKAQRALRKAYGKTGFHYKSPPPTPGKFGKRYWVWAIKNYELNQYVELSQEDKDAFDKAFFKDITEEEQEQRQEGALLEDLYYNLEITEEEYLSQKKKLMIFNFPACYARFKELTGKTLVRCQEYELNQPGAF